MDFLEGTGTCAYKKYTVHTLLCISAIDICTNEINSYNVKEFIPVFAVPIEIEKALFRGYGRNGVENMSKIVNETTSEYLANVLTMRFVDSTDQKPLENVIISMMFPEHIPVLGGKAVRPHMPALSYQWKKHVNRGTNVDEILLCIRHRRYRNIHCEGDTTSIVLFSFSFFHMWMWITCE